MDSQNDNDNFHKKWLEIYIILFKSADDVLLHLMGYNGIFRGEPESRVHPYIRGHTWITLQSNDQAGAYLYML